MLQVYPKYPPICTDQPDKRLKGCKAARWQAGREKAALEKDPTKELGQMTSREYGSRDTLLWTPMAAELFREKSRIRDKQYASDYMRAWFAEHEGLPIKPPTAPKSGMHASFFTFTGNNSKPPI